MSIRNASEMQWDSQGLLMPARGFCPGERKSRWGRESRRGDPMGDVELGQWVTHTKPWTALATAFC